MKEFYAPPLEMYRRMAEEKMLGGLLPRLLAWGADAKLGVAMRRERQVRAIKHDWSRSGRDWRIRSRSSTWQSERTKRQRAQHAWGSMWSLDTAGKPFMMFTTDRHGRLSEKDRATLEKVRTVAIVVVAAPLWHRCVWAARMRGWRGYVRMACTCEPNRLPNMAGPRAREGAAARRE